MRYWLLPLSWMARRTSSLRLRWHTCRNYTIEYTGPDGHSRRAKGYVDKQATLQLAARLERAAARGEEGMINQYLPPPGTPLTEHLAAYLLDPETAGRDAKYVQNMRNRPTVLFEGCGWKCLGNITPESFIRWRGQ